MSVRLRAPRVQTLVRVDRASFVGDLVQEILDDLTGGNHANLDEIVNSGIVKNQFLGQITVRYLLKLPGNDRPRQIAEVCIQIDWERYRINVAGLGPELEINSDESKVEQVSAVLVKLLQFLREYRERTGAKTQIVFQWAPGVDPKKASKEMNTRQAEDFEWVGGAVHNFNDIDASILRAADEGAREEKDVEYELTVTPELLDELRVVARFTDEERVRRLLSAQVEIREKD